MLPVLLPTALAVPRSPLHEDVFKTNTLCNIPISLEILRSDDLSAYVPITPPERCDAATIAEAFRRQPSCVIAVEVRHDELVSIRTAHVEDGQCVADPSPLDEPLNLSPKPGLRDAVLSLGFSYFDDSIGERMYETKWTEQTTLRDILDVVSLYRPKLHPWMSPDQRHSFIVTPNPVTGRWRVLSFLVGGKYPGPGPKFYDGPFDTRTGWWKADTSPRYRPWTPGALPPD